MNPPHTYVLCSVLPPDVNECLNQTVCGRGRCVNTEGSYRCNCFQGYKLSANNVCQGNRRSEEPSVRHNELSAVSVIARLRLLLQKPRGTIYDS